MDNVAAQSLEAMYREVMLGQDRPSLMMNRFGVLSERSDGEVTVYGYAPDGGLVLLTGDPREELLGQMRAELEKAKSCRT